jgi:predicted nucleic acid-binding protein
VRRRSRKYILDTQLFIRAFRDSTANEELQEFHRLFAPVEYFSVIVAQEIRAGVRRPGSPCTRAPRPDGLRAWPPDDSPLG